MPKIENKMQKDPNMTPHALKPPSGYEVVVVSGDMSWAYLVVFGAVVLSALHRSGGMG